MNGLDSSRLPNGPDLWRSILAEMPPGAVVAGGAVRDFLLGYEPKDIDVFMAIPPISHEPIPFPDLSAPCVIGDLEISDPRHGLLRIEVEHERFEEYTAVSNIVCVSSGTMHGWRVDAVDLDDFEGGEKLVTQFDFGITRCWFDGEIHDTPEAKRDREARAVTLLLDARKERSLARFERLKQRWGDDWTLRDSGSDAERGDALAAPSEGSQSGTRASAGIARLSPSPPGIGADELQASEQAALVEFAAQEFDALLEQQRHAANIIMSPDLATMILAALRSQSRMGEGEWSQERLNAEGHLAMVSSWFGKHAVRLEVPGTDADHRQRITVTFEDGSVTEVKDVSPAAAWRRLRNVASLTPKEQ